MNLFATTLNPQRKDDAMSLDVYLCPNKCPHCGRSDEGFSANITHNLGRMASSAGLYEYVWRPEEVEITKAGELIHALRVGITCMENNPEVFKKLDDPNGWGTYEQFLPWLKKYLNACTQFPEAEILISR